MVLTIENIIEDIDKDCKSLILSSYNFEQTTINDLSKFKQLKSLCLSSKGIRTIYKYPPNLEYLKLDYNKISYLFNLPKSLKYLNISNNFLLHLSIPLDIKLLELECSYNNLKILYDIPNSIEHLNLNNNNIFAISIPLNCVKLNLSNNNLSEIPFCPSKLSYLRLNNNFIKKIENIKETNLNELNISANNLEIIKNCPDSLETLYCSGNKIKKMELPSNLKRLYCSSNQLKYIDLRDSKKIISIVANDNPIEIIYFPVNPKIVNLQIDTKNLKYAYPIKECSTYIYDKKILINSATYIIKRFYKKYCKKQRLLIRI
tara:strand:+ start:1160 stop:2110 length:951 start_codon:yes stop_codon:yes gene_type:complete